MDATTPNRLCFRLLGEAALRAGSDGIDCVLPQKGLALLIYLAMSRGRPVSRAVLADLLWGNRVDSQARQNLRQCLLTLRRDLGPSLARALIVDDQSLALAADVVEVDALQFVARASAADPTERQRCIDLPWGPFLGGFTTGAEGFDEWAVAERQELDATAARVFAELAEQFDAAGDGERAIAALERLIAIDPAEEHRHRRLLTLEARTRGADAALTRGKTLIALLQREFDAEPEPATLALLEEFRCSARTQSKDARQTAIEPNELIQIELAATTATAPLGAKRASRAIAACAVASLAIAGGVLAGMRSSAPPTSTLEQGVQHDLATSTPRATEPGGPLQASASPSWRSPPLPSRSAGEEALGRERGLVAIAVLPFASRSEQAGALIADMMTDDLNGMLSRFSEFRVISGQTARSYQGQKIDAAAIGTELGVRYLLEGNVALRGDRLRVNVGLVDTVSRLQVWSHRYDRSGADRHAIQDEIVNNLGRELQIEVTQLESEHGTTDPNVHELVFKGWAAIWATARSGVESLREAERFFLQALSRDPDNTRAQAGLAAYHARMVAQLHTDDPAHLDKAEAILQRLIDQHPNMQGPYLDLGLVYATRDQNRKAARLFERSIELNPSHAPSYAQLGLALARMGRPKEGLEHILYAMQLSPRDPSMPYWLIFASRAELELGHYDKAIAYLERSPALSVRYPPSMLLLVAAYAQSGNMSAAHRQLEQLLQARPHLSREKLLERFGEAGGLRLSELVLGLRRTLAPAPLEKPQPAGEFDGIWRVEFANNEFCTEKSRTGLWSIRQGVLKAGETRGTVSSTGELRATWPALFDPTLTNGGSAKLEGDRGEGKWDGQLQCSGALTLMRVSGH